jgi:hypothetical protein
LQSIAGAVNLSVVGWWVFTSVTILLLGAVVGLLVDAATTFSRHKAKITMFDKFSIAFFILILESKILFLGLNFPN